MIGIKYQIQYKEKIIPYEIIRRKIKNMYIYIKDGEVTVKAPIKLKEKEIQNFVEKKANWIYEKIKEEQDHPKKEEKIEPEDIERLQKIVKRSMEKYVALLQELPKKVRIKDIKYAWGSCSSNRNITINQNLAKKEEKIIEYVVLHEMCHLKHMNHSKKFWDLVEKYMPDYQKYRTILKKS